MSCLHTVQCMEGPKKCMILRKMPNRSGPLSRPTKQLATRAYAEKILSKQDGCIVDNSFHRVSGLSCVDWVILPHDDYGRIRHIVWMRHRPQLSVHLSITAERRP